MRIAPRNVVLGLLCLGLAAAHFVGGPAAAPERAIERLAPALVPSEAASLELRGNGRRVLAAREGGAWVLPELFGHPADGPRIERLLTRLADLSTLDLLTEDPARHEEYGLVEARAQRLLVAGPGGAPMLDVFLARASTGNAFVRRVGDDAVYGAGALPDTSSDVQVWRALEAWVDADEALITRVELAGAWLPEGAPPLVLVRDPANYTRWNDAAGAPLRRELAELLVRDLTRLYPDRVVAGAAAPEHGLERPFVTAKVLDARGGEHTASMAAPAGEAGAFGVGSSGPWVVSLRTRTVEALVARCRALAP